MPAVLCFGDSNTWGFCPRTKTRYPQDVRWTGVLQRELGERFRVIEEGLNGRTTVWDDPVMSGRCGRAYLAPCLESHRPLDLVILALGTNDTKQRFSAPPYDIARGMALLGEMVLRSGAGPGGAPPGLLILAPPPLGPLTEFAETFSGAAPKAEALAPRYAAVARDLGCRFFDTAAVVTSSPVDGVHWEPEDHFRLAGALSPLVTAMCGER